MDTATSTLADEVEEGLDGSCDFSFSQYPPVQLPLDPTRHAKQPLKGFVTVICSHKENFLLSQQINQQNLQPVLLNLKRIMKHHMF